jgi:hypothetical protein
VYFSFFYPPVSTSDTEGTIGAVKKYRAEQITEKDIMLDAMASVNIETVGQAAEQASTKLAESAREALRAAEEAWASGRTPEMQKALDALRDIANKAEAMKEGKFKGPDAVRAEAAKVEAMKEGKFKGPDAVRAEAAKVEAMKGEAVKIESMKGEAARYYEAAAIAEQAKGWGAKIEAMTAAARSEQAAKVVADLKGVEAAAARFNELGVRYDLLKLGDAARDIAVRAEAMRTEGKAEEWAKLASEARTLGQKAEALKEFARPEQVRDFVEGTKVFERTISSARADVNGLRPEAAKPAIEAARSMAGKAAELARPVGEARTSQFE